MSQPSQADDEWQPVLERIDTWYARHAPAIHATLRPGVADAFIEKLEAKHGLEVPADARRLHRWHDGQAWSVGGMFGLSFLDLDSALAARAMWKHLEAVEMAPFNPVSNPPNAFRETYGGLLRHPFLHDGGGNHVGIDLAPGPDGTPGQIVTYGRDEPRNHVLAVSMLEFLRTYQQRLEAGSVVVKRVEGFDGEMWSVMLLDAAGRSDEGYFDLGDLFPGFGASPPHRRSS